MGVAPPPVAFSRCTKTAPIRWLRLFCYPEKAAEGQPLTFCRRKVSKGGRLVDAKRSITLRHLVTHTSGLGTLLLKSGTFLFQHFLDQ